MYLPILLLAQNKFCANSKVSFSVDRDKNVCQIETLVTIKNYDTIPYTIIIGDTAKENNLITVETDESITPINHWSIKLSRKLNPYPHYLLHPSCPEYYLSQAYSCFVIYPDSVLIFKYREQLELNKKKFLPYFRNRLKIDIFIWFLPKIQKLSYYDTRFCMTSFKDETIRLRYKVNLKNAGNKNIAVNAF